MKYSSSFEELSDLENFMLITKVMYVHNTYKADYLLSAPVALWLSHQHEGFPNHSVRFLGRKYFIFDAKNIQTTSGSLCWAEFQIFDFQDPREICGSTTY